MSTSSSEECCPRFDPAPWEDKEVVWENRRFVADRVRSFFHIPLNFGSVMRRNMALIEAAGAKSEQVVVLSQDRSLWSSDVFIEVTKDVPGARMTTISGTFLSKVFEGPYQNMGKWIAEMKQYVASKGKALKTFYCFYTTCPKCAKKYGKNYVVLLAQV